MSTWRRSERGQALIEFALVAPLVLVFLLAMVDFGIAVNRRIVLDHGAREGARYAAVSGQALQTGIPASKAEIVAYTMAQAQDIPDVVDVCYEDTNGTGPGDTGDNVKVRIQYTHDFITGFSSIFDTSLGSIVMDLDASARVEKPANGVGPCA